MGRMAAWSLLGIVLLIAFGDAWYWALVAGALWLIGAAGVRRLRPEHTSAVWDALRDSRVARISVVLLVSFLVAATHLFGLPAGVLFATAAIGLAAVLVSSRGAERAFSLFGGLGAAGVSLLLLALGGEVLVSVPSVAARWGSRGEQARWQSERYDELARRGNIYGFRSPYEQIWKPPGAFRVVVLGDSFTWGDKVASTADLWTSHLESHLESHLGAGASGQTVEVVNLAKKGYSTLNEAEVMDRLGWQMEPDLVLIQFLTNDVYAGGPNFATTDGNTIWGSYRLLPQRLRQGAAGRSELLAFLEHNLNLVLRRADHAALYHDDYEGWRQLQAAIGGLGDGARQRGVPVAMIQTPHFLRGRWTAETHPYSDVYRRVAEVARRAGLAVLDLTPHFAELGQPGESWWATPYDHHPNEAAHAVIGGAVAEFLLARGVPQDF